MRRNPIWSLAVGALVLLAVLPRILSRAAASKELAASEKVIYTFSGGDDGAGPISHLILDSAGNLYGTTSTGGTGTACGLGYGCGTVFELKHTNDGWKKQVLYSFQSGDDGAFPQAGLVFDAAGNLYGTTSSGGGSEGPGTVFKLMPTSKGGTESVIYRFTFEGSSGTSPSSDLTIDAQGNLYGTTAQFGDLECPEVDCGTVFELIPHSDGTWLESTIHQFAGGPGDGAMPSSGIVLDSAGNVYGLTNAGGAGKCDAVSGQPGCGIAYKLTPGDGTWTETVLYSFARGGGRAVNPSAGVILDRAGLLFGTTGAGGDGEGTVFTLNQSKKGWDQTVIHRFYGNPDGIGPAGQLTRDGQGNLFGVTVAGGLSRYNGMVFELYRASGDWKERVVHQFAGGADGENPEAGLVSDGHGHLYGTTFRGGLTTCPGGCGTVYEITP
jgi:uncharacterized repeat protein (TIGR03803 family)